MLRNENHRNSWLTLIVVIMTGALLAMMVAPLTQAAEEGHGSDKGHSESGGKGKGPAFKGGDKGESHSKEGHAGSSGTSHSEGSSGDASKNTEEKVFNAPITHGKGKGGPQFKGGKGGSTGKHEEGGEAGHTH